MLFTTLHPLILASASPRRRELLASLGLDFEIRPAGEEPPPEMNEDPKAYALRAAAAKSREIAQERPGSWVLGADSVVTLQGAILGKPRDPAEALEMLQKLCGAPGVTEHQVITGCSLQRHPAEGDDPTPLVLDFAVSTTVRMPQQPEAVRRAYVASEEPMDKAGAYAIQGLGGFLVQEIFGSYTNVVGLPLAEVVEVFVAWGVAAPNTH